MMLLGVFVHAAIVIPAFMPVSPLDAVVFDVSYAFVHLFRMPVFFLISGIFAARLLRTEGVRAFLISRFKRIVSVFLTAAAIVAIFLWNSGCTWCAPTDARDYVNTGLIYLWFLYYLAIVSHLALVLWLAVRLFKTRMRDSDSTPTSVPAGSRRSRLRLRPLEAAAVSLLLALIPGLTDSTGQVRVEMGWIPNLSLLLFFGTFFAIGWFIDSDREITLGDIKSGALWNTALAAVFSAGSWLLMAESAHPWQPAVQVVAVTFAAFAVTGLFLRYLHAESDLVRYLADSSYWVYLFHAPVMYVTVYALSKTGLEPLLVAAISITTALAATLVSYHYLVRPTIIGRYLSGRRRPRRIRGLVESTHQTNTSSGGNQAKHRGGNPSD
ncbi:MAG: hypothetical protein RL009_443 [Actinomycetota bacterium]